MQIVRIYADGDGASHFDEVTVSLTPKDFAPPAPPFSVSEATPAAQLLYFEMPSGWHGTPHPAPRRQVYIGTAGTLRVTVSDGEERILDPGAVVLLEDVDGVGHTTEVVSDEPARGVFVQLPS